MKVDQLFPQRTLAQWLSQHEQFDSSPTFQRRGKLWNLDKKQLLINSVLNQYDVPKFYMADFSYSPSKIQSSKKLYAIIDGKQRFEAFIDFFENRLTLGDTNINFNEQVLNLPGLSYQKLRDRLPDLAYRFDQYSITVMGVFTEHQEEIEELFIRLNTGVAISGPERRNAMPGPIPSLIRRIVGHNFFGKHAPFRTDRGQDLNVAAKLLIIEYYDRITATYSKDLNDFVEKGKNKKEAEYKPAEDAVSSNLNRMTQVFGESDWLLRGQAQLVTYYCFLKTLSDRELGSVRAFLEFFEHQRKRVKQETKDRGEKNVPNRDRLYLDYNLSFRSPDSPGHQKRMIELLTEAHSQFRS
ncbi:MAG TPA: DUF262 domain-containing protein [Anaerolineales bacterium]|nr:DUF262 domain-containing protein [Anaerolineales bacterium]HRQ91600.1 DUF262 domain-containing protein [Anaerolineales bacterium]